jgi:hypothetical protein
MARKQEAAQLLTAGLSPSQIARKMGVSIETVMPYLYDQVGQGNIRRSDIVFSIDPKLRRRAENALRKWGADQAEHLGYRYRRSGKPAKEDMGVYLALRDARVAYGDMYELIRHIELSLHQYVKDTLCAHFGGTGWWRKGIPERIRAECASALERDPEPCAEPYSYTTFIHLKVILDARWHVLSAGLPGRFASNKQILLSSLTRLNVIRNAVMHPVKGLTPTEEDFAFVRDFKTSLGGPK